MRTKRHIVIPEVNYRGQFANLVMGKYPRDAVRVNVYGGRPMLVDKLVEAIRQVARGEVTDRKIVISPITFPLEELVTPDDLIAPVEQR